MIHVLTVVSVKNENFGDTNPFSMQHERFRDDKERRLNNSEILTSETCRIVILLQISVSAFPKALGYTV
jgi:hypothetical protein